MYIESGDAIAKEKQKARELRDSRWWREKTQNASCHYCQKPLLPKEATMDHVIPLLRGGKSTKDNIVVACKSCNNKKRDEMPF